MQKGFAALVVALAVAAGAEAAAQRAEALAPMVAGDNAPCTNDAEDLRLAPCRRATWDARLQIIYRAGALAAACRRRDGAWVDDFGTVVGALATSPREGSDDPRMGSAAIQRARAGLRAVLGGVEHRIATMGRDVACGDLATQAAWLRQADALVGRYRREVAALRACLRRSDPAEDCGIPRVGNGD